MRTLSGYFKMPTKRKTWSRETAAILLAILCWTIYQENVPLVTAIIWPFTSYAAVAFGIKRIDDSNKLWLGSKPSEPGVRRGAERSGQRTGRSGEQPRGKHQD